MGSNVRAQRAEKAKSIADVFKRMKKQEFVVETKFDGWRIQVRSFSVDEHVDQQPEPISLRGFCCQPFCPALPGSTSLCSI